MNINHIFKKWSNEGFQPHLVYPLNLATTRLILLNRQRTFRAFAKLENSKGFLAVPTDLSTTKGQEMVRILYARSIEEILECFESRDLSHRKEEAIDFLNYAISIPLLQLDVEPQKRQTKLNKAFEAAVLTALTQCFNSRINWIDGDIMWHWLRSSSPLLEALRNRSWMNQSQSAYFDGWELVFNLVGTAFEITALVFAYDWDEFIRFYFAKDEVLQFRIKTKY